MVSIGFSGVTLERGGRALLVRAHLAIGPSDLVLVTGPRGAGKSLLLAAAAGLVTPREGSVLIAGRELAGLQASARPYVRRNIGYLPADPPFVWDETALENVMLALGVRGFVPSEAEALARRTLAQLGAEPLAERPMTALSMGERRLVGAARALAGPAPIVILDEPSAGLDAADRDRLVDTIAVARAGGAALLCASNDAVLGAALSALGARHLELCDGHLTGDHAVVRLVEGDADGTPAGDRRAVVLSFPARSAREVS